MTGEQPAAQEDSPAALRIEVDYREAQTAVLAALQARNDVEVCVAHLPLGDYRVEGKLLFERKTLSDLTLSIKDGRLFQQALRMSRSKLRAAIILEGTANDLAASSMRWEAIQGALINVTLFCGVPILRARTADETASTLVFCARQAATQGSGALPRKGTRPRGKRARQLYILQGLPGIGPERARRLLARFGSVEAIARATAEELQCVAGIGRDTASAVRWAVDEPRRRYGGGVGKSECNRVAESR